MLSTGNLSLIVSPFNYQVHVSNYCSISSFNISINNLSIAAQFQAFSEKFFELNFPIIVNYH